MTISGHHFPTSNRFSQVFKFPSNTHLLITTPGRILTWDRSGLRPVFTSNSHGIAAGTEAKDGSGVLAVADKHTVILHDTRRRQEKSWGLTADDDKVRHLQYTGDGNSLFLTTHATHSIQCYSTQRKTLLNPPQTLTSPPVVLSVSSSGRHLISASRAPPAVYLKGLSDCGPAVTFLPTASKTSLVIAAFHPEREHVYLLGFEDGTLAAYDNSRISAMRHDGLYSDQEVANHAEIGRLHHLHQATAPSSPRKVGSIAGAAFLPGYKLRAVSVGSDGKCKLIDFADGGIKLRA